MVGCFPRREIEHKSHLIEGRFLEAIMEVEVFGLVGKGMDYESSDASLFGNDAGSQNCIFQQARPHAFFLPMEINSKPTQYHDRYWIRHSAFNLVWCISSSYASCSQSIEADNNLIFTNNKGSGRS